MGTRWAYNATGDPYPHAEAQRRDNDAGGAVWLLAPILIPIAVALYVRRHPYVTLFMVVCTAVFTQWGTVATVAVAGVITVSLALWRRLARDTFDHIAAGPGAQWRGLWSYRRRWARIMRDLWLDDGCGITRYVPRLLRVTGSAGADHLLIRPMAGQTSVDFLDRTDQLAAALGAHTVRVRLGRKGTLWLDVHRDGRGHEIERVHTTASTVHATSHVARQRVNVAVHTASHVVPSRVIPAVHTVHSADPTPPAPVVIAGHLSHSSSSVLSQATPPGGIDAARRNLAVEDDPQRLHPGGPTRG